MCFSTQNQTVAKVGVSRKSNGSGQSRFSTQNQTVIPSSRRIQFFKLVLQRNKWIQWASPSRKKAYIATSSEAVFTQHHVVPKDHSEEARPQQTHGYPINAPQLQVLTIPLTSHKKTVYNKVFQMLN